MPVARGWKWLSFEVSHSPNHSVKDNKQTKEKNSNKQWKEQAGPDSFFLLHGLTSEHELGKQPPGNGVPHGEGSWWAQTGTWLQQRRITRAAAWARNAMGEGWGLE